ncbi:MAG: glycosyltransferase [Candidatus Omnitrophica bacterium]|nr:glycosyltransferase [Candidatus Omnitrophota bacterium]
MNASVIVPVYNRESLIQKCLNSLLSQHFDDYEIIVVDDGSTDSTRQKLENFKSHKQVRIFYNDKNMGPSYARNKAIALSQGTILAFIDSDCEALEHWLEELMKPFKQDPTIMIAAGMILDPKTHNYWECVNKGGDFIAHIEGAVKNAIGCNMAIRREFLKSNPFDEKIPTSAAEDLDLCQRCLKTGNKIYYNPNAAVIHYRRSNFRNTIRQQFSYGYWNTYVNIKNQRFPFINYGSWILIGSFIAFLLKLPVLIPLFFLCSYLTLVSYVSLRPKLKTWPEVIMTYPGFLMGCLANFAGNIFYLFQAVKDLIQFSGRKNS